MLFRKESLNEILKNGFGDILNSIHERMKRIWHGEKWDFWFLLPVEFRKKPKRRNLKSQQNA